MNNSVLISRDDAFVAKLKQIVFQNLDNGKFGVNTLAHEVGYSRSQLHRKIKSIQGKSISRFIRDTRLEMALPLIRNQVGTISEIAYRVGFNSPAYFTRCFNQKYGCAPSELESNGHHGDRQVLAVLPFANLSTDEDSHYIIDGIYQSIISTLGKVKGLRVIASNWTIRDDSESSLVTEIAHELGIKFLLEGSVHQYQNNVRIKLELIKIYPQKEYIWSQKYLVHLKNILSIINELVRAIAMEIGVFTEPDEIAYFSKAKRVNPDTYKAYLKGIHVVRKDLNKGIRYLQQAIDNNPTDPMAYTNLALAYVSIGHGPDPRSRYWNRAKAAAEIAIKLDSTLAEAYGILAMINTYYEFNWLQAEQLYRKAIEINDNIAMVHFHYAWYLVIMGRYTEAVEEHLLAKRLDPLTPIYTADMGSLYFWLRQPDHAMKEIEQALELDPNFDHTWWVMGNIYNQKGMHEEAKEAHKKAVSINPVWNWALAHSYALAGDREKAGAMLSEIKSGNISSREAMGLVFIHAALGETDDAFKWMNTKPQDTWIGALRTWPGLDILQRDPRFNDFLKALDLPPMTYQEA